MVFFVIGLFVVAFGALLALGSTRTEAALTSGEETPLDDRAVGDFVTVRGSLDADEELVAPLSGRRCVFFRLYFIGDPEGRPRRRERPDVELLRTERAAEGLRVQVEDATLLLDSTGAELHVQRQHATAPSLMGGGLAEAVWREHAPGLRDHVNEIVEHRLELDEPVTVVGHLQEAPAGRYLAGPDLAISSLPLEVQRSRATQTRLLGAVAILAGLFIAFASFEDAKADWTRDPDPPDRGLREWNERRSPQR